MSYSWPIDKGDSYSTHLAISAKLIAMVKDLKQSFPNKKPAMFIWIIDIIIY